MAKKRYRPGRTVLIFFSVIAAGYALVAATGTAWTPALGLDLQGGTRITLVTNDKNATPESMDQAVSIIDQRVNGSGVNEAEVTKQGNNLIVVEIPGDTRRDLVETVKRQAQLRFRLVACTAPGPACGSSSATTQTPQELPGVPGVTLPSGASVSIDPGSGATSGNGGGGNQSGTANRPPLGFADKSDSTSSPTGSPTGSPTSSPTSTSSPTDGGSASAPAAARRHGRPRRPAAEVDGQPRPGLDQGVQRVHLSRRRAKRPSPRTTLPSPSSPATRTA